MSYFKIEHLEYIRITMGEKVKILKSRKNGFINDKKILSEEKRKNLIKENEKEQALAAFIEAIAMREISNTIIDESE